MKKYNISNEDYKEIKNECGCYLKYDKSYMDLVSDNEHKAISYNKWYWMFGYTNVSFDERSNEELSKDSSTISGGYEHILVIKIDPNYSKTFEENLKQIYPENKMGKKEIWKCDLYEFITNIKKAINVMEVNFPDFKYHIYIINNTRYTSKLNEMFDIKRINKRYSNRPSDKCIYRRHKSGLIYRNNETTGTWSTLTTDGIWTENRSFHKFVKLVRESGYSITNNDGGKTFIKQSEIIEIN